MTVYLQPFCDADDSFDALCLFIWKSLLGEPFQHVRTLALLLVSAVMFIILVNPWNLVSCENTDPLRRSDTLSKGALPL